MIEAEHVDADGLMIPLTSLLQDALECEGDHWEVDPGRYGPRTIGLRQRATGDRFALTISKKR